MNSASDTLARKNTLPIIAAAIVLIAMTAVGIFIYGADLGGLCLFAAFILFYVMMPGLLLITPLRNTLSHYSTYLAVGLFTGWALNICLYFITDLIGTDILLMAAGPALSVIFIIKELRSREYLRRAEYAIRHIPLSFCICIILTLLYALLTTQYQYLSPALSDYVCVNPDKAYHMGLIDSLSHDYPLASLWIQGRTINYHIFTEMLYSIPVRLFGMDADFIMMSCGPYMTTFTLGLSMYSFFSEMSHKAGRAGIYCLIVILSSLYICRSWYNSIAFTFAITNDNSAGFGIASALVFIVILKYYFEDSAADAKSRIPVACLLTALLMLTTGIKGPMGAVLIAGLWGTLMLGWILRKIPFRSVLPALVMSGGFILIYKTVLGSKGQSNASGESVIEFATITDICFWKKPLIGLLKSLYVPQSIRLGIILLVFIVFFLTVFFLPFCIGYLRELFLVLGGRKGYLVHEVTVYAAFAVGFVAMFILNYSGHSQIYFGLLSAFLAPLIAFWFLEDMEDVYPDASSRVQVLIGIVRGVVIISLICTTIMLGYHYYRLLPSAVKHADPALKYNKYLSMSSEEYEAMKWIKDNTPEDSLLATDRYYSVKLDEYSYENRWSNRFFLYASYSNRFCYIAGSGYNLAADEWNVREEMITRNMELYDADNESRGDDARELGVDYVVVSKRFTDTEDLSNDDYILCFQNDDIDIYQIDDAA